MLKQDQYSPFSVEDQIVSIYLAGEGHYDSVPVDDVRNFETQLLSHLHHNAKGVYDSIAGGKALSDDQAELRRQPDSASEGEGVIRVMTVHGAKGLESPVVILPDCARRKGPGRTAPRSARAPPAGSRPGTPWRR